MQAEARLVRKIMDAVKLARPGATVWKLADRYNRGRPDLFIMYPKDGAVFVLMVEVKTPTGKLSRIQEQVIKKLSGLALLPNFAIITARAVEDVLQAL